MYPLESLGLDTADIYFGALQMVLAAVEKQEIMMALEANPLETNKPKEPLTPEEFCKKYPDNCVGVTAPMPAAVDTIPLDFFLPFKQQKDQQKNCQAPFLCNPPANNGQPGVPKPQPLKDISQCLNKANQAWQKAKKTYGGEIGVGAAGTALTVGILFIPVAGEVEAGELLLDLAVHGSPALTPGPILMVNGMSNLDDAYHDYLNQTASCTP
jgi:hypothetical protein